MLHLYSISFQLLNLCEVNGAVQNRRRQQESEGLHAVNGLWGNVLRDLKDKGAGEKFILEQFRNVEVEPVLTAHPKVQEAAVVGVPHDTWGEVGRAFLVVDDGYDEADLKAFLDERLARYKLPRSIVILDALPLTAIGKLDKKLLEQYEVKA